MSNILQQLSEAVAHKTLIEMDMKEKRDAIMATIAKDLRDLEEEYAPSLEQVQLQITKLELAARQEVIAKKETDTDKDAGFQVVYVPGKVTWDTKGLEGYAVGHPEILVFKKVGEPSTTLRKV